jgi:hypothetical protein
VTITACSKEVKSAAFDPRISKTASIFAERLTPMERDRRTPELRPAALFSIRYGAGTAMRLAGTICV